MDKEPKQKMNYETRTISFIVTKKDDHIFSNGATVISIEDDGGGEFISVSQDGEEVRFDAEEWPVVRSAIDKIIGECRG